MADGANARVLGLIEAGLAEVVTESQTAPLEVAVTEAGRRYLDQTRAP